MASEETKTTETTTDNAGQKNEVPTEEKLATQNAELTKQVQDLMKQVATLKSASDKNSAEAAEFKRKYRETLSAQEQASQDKAEREAEHEAYVKKLERENSVNAYVRKYMAQGYSEELAQKAAEAMYDGDVDAFFGIQSEATKEIVEAKEREWLKSRPDVNAGTGTTSITKEQFENMNMMERSELRRNSPDVYEQLIGRK